MSQLYGPIDGVYDVYVGENLREVLTEAQQKAVCQRETVSVRFNRGIIINVTPNADLEHLYQVYSSEFIQSVGAL